MRRCPLLTAYVLAAGCWLAAGPGGVPVEALLACRHHQTHQSHAGHAGAPSDGPCFCAEMAGGSDLVVSPAVPAPLVAALLVTTTPRPQLHPALFALPPSPSFAPSSPPPNGLA